MTWHVQNMHETAIKIEERHFNFPLQCTFENECVYGNTFEMNDLDNYF